MRFRTFLTCGLLVWTPSLSAATRINTYQKTVSAGKLTDELIASIPALAPVQVNGVWCPNVQVFFDGSVTRVMFDDATSSASVDTVVNAHTQSPTGSASSLTSFPTLNQSTTGSAASLTTARTINGTSFDGTGNITVTAAAGTLTGATLASGVTASSLTSVGTLASPTLTTPTINGSKRTGVNRKTVTVVSGTAAQTLSGANMAAGAVFELTGTTARTFTLDTGTNLSTAVPGVAVGDAIQFVVKCSGTSTGTITMAGAAGTTLSSTAVIAIGTSRLFTAVNTGSNAWTIY